MESEAYIQWKRLFDDNVLQSYNNEKKELQNAAMLLTALKTEFQNVSRVLELQFDRLKRQLKDNTELKEQITSPGQPILQSIHNSPKLELKVDLPNNETDHRPVLSDLESPDIFINQSLKPVEQVSPTSVIDLSKSDDDTSIEDSPTLISKRKKDVTKKDKIDCLKKNIFRGIDKENFYIECTPEAKSPKKIGKKRGTVKKPQKSTITQLFNEISTREKSSELTNVVEEPTATNQTFQEWIKDEDGSVMGITKLLSFINKDDTPKSIKNQGNQNDDEMDSTNEVDEFSKAILFEDSPGMDSSPLKKRKISPRAEPVVRGHARKLLNGFSCLQCREFYAGMNLSPTELQKRLDECSKHRYKYQPPEDTYPGIWDLTIPAENINMKMKDENNIN
ncbi:uncharacterized protein LOC114330511 [Diabrotica virgifera virgifera]|uniref:DNA endonuclease RBBP8-like n=1 Tax=Diabrotica virgifera virgifera TaxID=50390 RepID=A0ABM5ILF6_DIAVI|nr:uncharacterized protein LOC114330511 [Diabrotica virgifera virgifera]